MNAPRIVGSPAERFWPKVDKEGPVPEPRPDLGPCWLWTASTDGNGYGAFFDGTLTGAGNKRVVKAYRWAWVQENGVVPEGLELDHLCRVTLCVRPSHLEAVTHRENMMRSEAPAIVAHRTGRCRADRHDLVGENVYQRTNGVECRVCRNERSAAWRQANR